MYERRNADHVVGRPKSLCSSAGRWASNEHPGAKERESLLVRIERIRKISDGMLSVARLETK